MNLSTKTFPMNFSTDFHRLPHMDLHSQAQWLRPGRRATVCDCTATTAAAANAESSKHGSPHVAPTTKWVRNENFFDLVPLRLIGYFSSDHRLSAARTLCNIHQRISITMLCWQLNKLNNIITHKCVRWEWERKHLDVITARITCVKTVVKLIEFQQRSWHFKNCFSVIFSLHRSFTSSSTRSATAEHLSDSTAASGATSRPLQTIQPERILHRKFAAASNHNNRRCTSSTDDFRKP